MDQVTSSQRQSLELVIKDSDLGRCTYTCKLDTELREIESQGPGAVAFPSGSKDTTMGSEAF